MTHRRASGLASFLAIWFGQTFSLLGSALTSFALGIWVYQESGSVTRFTTTALCAVIPPLLLSPFAGSIVDRWDRRRAMILGDAGAGLGTLALAWLFWAGRVEFWHICALLALNAAFSSLQFPAFSASITLLVPKRHFGRANGLVQFGHSIATLVAPLASGFLLDSLQIKGIVAIDFLTCLVAIGTLLAVRIPRVAASEAGAAPRKPSAFADAALGWRYIRTRPGLTTLLLLFLGVNFVTTCVESLITPLVLSFASATVLGIVVSGAGIGMVLGGMLMTAWGGPRRRMPAVLGFLALQGTMLLVGGLRPSAVLISAAAFVYLFCTPIINGSAQVIWQSKIPPGLQGRVFAIRQMVAMSALPIAYLVVGPLSDYVFEPALAPGGPLAASFGPVLGTGPGRGLGLFLLVLGVLVLAAAAAARRSASLRDLEDRLPDEVPEDLETIRELPNSSLLEGNP